SMWAGHVWAELQSRYRTAGKLDKALSAGSSLLVLEPNNLEAACLNWRIASDMKDTGLTDSWIRQTASVADRVLKTPNAELSKAAVECGNTARQAMDFEQYKAAVTTADAASRVRALEEFTRMHPQNS